MSKWETSAGSVFPCSIQTLFQWNTAQISYRFICAITQECEHKYEHTEGPTTLFHCKSYRKFIHFLNSSLPSLSLSYTHTLTKELSVEQLQQQWHIPVYLHIKQEVRSNHNWPNNPHVETHFKAGVNRLWVDRFMLSPLIRTTVDSKNCSTWETLCCTPSPPTPN